MEGRVYVARMDAISVAAAKTLIDLTAPSTAVLEILRAWISQDTSETSTQEVAEIGRKTAAGAGGAAFTPVKFAVGDSASGVTASIGPTGEGSGYSVLIREGFNLVNGWLYLPVPEERIQVPPSGIISLKLAQVTATITVSAGIVWKEVG